MGSAEVDAKAPQVDMRNVKRIFRELDDGNAEGDYMYAVFAVDDLRIFARGRVESSRRSSILNASDEMMLQLDCYGGEVENPDAEDGPAMQEERDLRSKAKEFLQSRTELSDVSFNQFARYSDARYKDYARFWERYSE